MGLTVSGEEGGEGKVGEKRKGTCKFEKYFSVST